MRHSNQVHFRQQVTFLRRQFLQDGDLPFTNVLSVELVSQALTAAGVVWNDSIYQPLVALWIFLSQVLSQDHSCRATVARLIADRQAHGQRPYSAETGAYCQARKRLSEAFIATIVRTIGRKLEDQAKNKWLWKGHHVYLFDGTTTLMPETAENRAAYPLRLTETRLLLGERFIVSRQFVICKGSAAVCSTLLHYREG